MHASQKTLFSQRRLSEVLDEKIEAMVKDIRRCEAERVMGTPVADLAQEFVQRYGITPITIDESAIQVEPREVQVDVSGDRTRHILDRSRPVYVMMTFMVLHVPFSGDPSLFDCRPSRFDLSPPQGVVLNRTLELAVCVADGSAEAVRAELRNKLAAVKAYVANISADLRIWYKELMAAASACIEARKKKLQQDRELASKLGFPLKGGS